MSQLKITLIKSKYGRKPNQAATLEALGLRKMHVTVTKPDNEVTRGMIQCVHHLVRVEESA